MDDIDHLYDLDLQAFTSARNALVKQLKKEGDASRAAEVAALRKPSKLAWAVNQAVRAEPALLNQLLVAGDALRDAQAVLVETGNADVLRGAASDRRAAADALADSAASFADPSVRDDALATLEAGAVTDDGRELLRSGRLTAAIEATANFGTAGGFTMTPPVKGDKVTGVDRLEHKRRERRKNHAERDHDRALHRLAEAEDAFTEAERELKEARERAALAEQELLAASASLDEM
jgi:hypothetical protein